jgi:hypothetical protein
MGSSTTVAWGGAGGWGLGAKKRYDAPYMKWGLGFVVLLCQAQQELPPDLALLSKIKVKESQNLDQLPNYTCAETIERWVKRSNESNAALLDTVRLEVAYVEGRELYGLAGAKIDQSQIKKLVRGTIGEGGFAMKVKEVFQGQAATFHYEGRTELNGKSSEVFTFRVARLVSGYRITTPSGSATLGYRGRFWADASSLDLIQLELTADDIPSALQLSAASESIEYRRIAIGNGSFLLPHSSEMILADAAGSEATNRSNYEACRQFAAESVLSFTEIRAEPAVGANGPLADARGARAGEKSPGGSAANLPEEFTVDISLETPIDSDSASAGDPVSATLRQSIKMEKTTVAPKGAKLSGKIARFDKDGGSYSMDLKFSSIDFNDSHVDLSQRKNDVLMKVTTRVSSMSSVASAQAQPVEQVDETLSPLVFKTKHLKLGRGTHLVLSSKK